jgi:integrase
MGRTGSGIDEHNGALRLRFTLEGKRHSVVLRVTSGTPLEPTAANLRFALRLSDDVQRAIRAGHFSWIKFFPYHSLARTDDDGVTVGQHLDNWLDSLRVEYSTLKSYRTAVAFWKSTAVGGKRAPDLVKSDVLKALATRPTLTGKTINNYMVALRQGLGLAVDDGRLAINVALSVKSQKNQRPEPDPFTREEAEAICEDMRTHYDERAYLFTLAKFWTGLRSSEAYGLRWADVDLPAETIFIHRGVVLGRDKLTTKTKQTRTVMLNSIAFGAFQAMKRHTYLAGDHVFTDPRREAPWGMDANFTRFFWIPTIKRLGIRYRPPYNTRHTYATQLLMAGRKPAWCAQQLGHDIKMFYDHYARWIPSEGDAVEMARFEATLAESRRTKGLGT